MREFLADAWMAFSEGFVGAIRLVAALIMAPIDVIWAFANHRPLRMRDR
jgi:hypothetical protein